MSGKGRNNFYTVAALEGFILTAWAIWVASKSTSFLRHEDHRHSSGACFSTDSYEYLWRIVATAIAVPLLIETLLDFMVNATYPTLSTPDGKVILEDRLGHAIIVGSLLPVSYLPFWIAGDSVCYYRDALVSLSHGLMLCGVLGKLETFSSDIWHQSDAVMVLSLFVGAQLCLLNGIEVIEGAVTYNLTTLQLAFALKFLSTLVFLTSSRNIKLVFEEVSPIDNSFIVTRRYFCTALFIGLALFMMSSTYFCYQAYIQMPIATEIIATRICITILGVVATAIVPGRIMRRGLQAVQQTAAIKREMNYKKTFVRYISHEIRSPLSNTSMGLDCILDHIKSSRRVNIAELLDLARDCKLACTSAILTLSDLLLFDKIENQMLVLEKTSVQCDKFLKQSIAIFSRPLKLSGITFVVDVDMHLAHMTMQIDAMKIDQVIRNFISNASKFTSPGGTITVRARLLSYEESAITNTRADASSGSVPPTSVLHFEVIDTGVGISKENQARLFQQYVQFDANRLQGGKGSGLGLWICKTIVDLHGGCVGASSPGEGCGSTFFFEVPIAEMISPVGKGEKAVVSIAEDTLSKGRSRRVRGQLKSTPQHTPSAFQSISTLDEPNYKQCSSPSPVSFISDTPTTRASNAKSGRKSTSVPVDDLSPTTLNSVTTRKTRSSSPFLSVGSGSEGKQKSRPSLVAESLSMRAMKGLHIPDADASAQDTFDEYAVSEISSDSQENHVFPRIGANYIAPSFSLRRDKLRSLYLQGDKWTVLVADDSNICRKLMTRLLTPYSNKVLSAVDGLDAIDQLSRNSGAIDIIFMDYYMPKLNGPEASFRIRSQLHFDGVIVAVSGALSFEEQQLLFAAGVDVIAAKPFNLSSFLDIAVGNSEEFQ